MKFLHISDLHYHPDEDGRTSSEIREKLIKYLTDNGIFADELIITGDFRHALYSKKPIQETANDVKEYIMTIAKTIGIDTSECIHIIPGNHDRKRPKNMSRMNRIKTNYSYESGKFNLDDTKYINTQFEFFKELCKRLYGDNNF